MQLKQTQALVLGVTPHGEADKIVTLYGRETGRLTGIAKGANRSRVRFVNKLEIFSLLEVHYEEGRSSSLVRIDQAELLKPFAAIRRDYPRYAAAGLAGELVIRFCSETEADPRIFQLLLWALAALATEAGPAAPPAPNPAAPQLSPSQLGAIVTFFEIRLLDLLGYRPDLAGCRRCGTLGAEARPYHFSLGKGGLLCRLCNREQHGLLPVSLATARLLSRALELECDKLHRLRLPADACREAQKLLMHYSRHLLQREINARPLFTDLLNV